MNREYGYSIIKTASGAIVYTPFVVGSGIDVGYNVTLDDGDTLLAVVHTHPSGLPEFSAGDIANQNALAAQGLVAPSYVFTKQGEILVYNPRANTIGIVRSD
jgi:proteasome lid subunit RPN8/RPN11